MRRGGATGDDWSDWEAHLPSSPEGTSSSGGGGGGWGAPPHLDPRASGASSLRGQTSDKFELGEGGGPRGARAQICLCRAPRMHALAG